MRAKAGVLERTGATAFRLRARWPTSRATRLASWLTVVGLGSLQGTACRQPWNRVTAGVVEPRLEMQARLALELLSANHVDSAYAMFRRDIRATSSVEDLRVEASALIGRALDSVNLIGVRTQRRPDLVEITLSYQVTSDTRFFAAAIAMTPEPAENLLGLHIESLDASLAESHRFTLAKKPVTHFFWLLFMLGSSLTCIGSAYRLAIARGMKRRWLWSLVALVATPTFTLDWTSGQTGLGAAALFGISIVRSSPWSPWIMGFGVPLGALVAVAKLKYWRAARTGITSTT